MKTSNPPWPGYPGNHYNLPPTSDQQQQQYPSYTPSNFQSNTPVSSPSHNTFIHPSSSTSPVKSQHPTGYPHSPIPYTPSSEQQPVAKPASLYLHQSPYKRHASDTNSINGSPHHPPTFSHSYEPSVSASSTDSFPYSSSQLPNDTPMQNRFAASNSAGLYGNPSAATATASANSRLGSYDINARCKGPKGLPLWSSSNPRSSSSTGQSTFTYPSPQSAELDYSKAHGTKSQRQKFCSRKCLKQFLFVLFIIAAATTAIYIAAIDARSLHTAFKSYPGGHPSQASLPALLFSALLPRYTPSLIRWSMARGRQEQPQVVEVSPGRPLSERSTRVKREEVAERRYNTGDVKPRKFTIGDPEYETDPELAKAHAED